MASSPVNSPDIVADQRVDRRKLADYLVAHCTPADELLRELAEETRDIAGERARMQVSPEIGQLLGMLVGLGNAKRAIEVGVFTGYSSICIARAMGPDGRLLACDINEDWLAIARRYWERAGVSDRIDLRVAPAAETLLALPEEEVFDLAFIDADKPGYPVYYEQIVRRIRPGGLIVLDNVLWSGDVLNPEPDTDGETMHRVNETISNDPRVDTVMLPLRDGLSLVRKR